ncbi:MAG: DUF2924 domain-containing protein [Roseibium sp.]
MGKHSAERRAYSRGAGVETKKIPGKHKLNNREDVIRDWVQQFGSRPPRNISTLFMRRALSFESQCASNPALKRLSKTLHKDIKSGLKTRSSGLCLSVGSHLVRQWNGRTYQVEVLDTGFVMDGKSYRSLTSIAKKITGTNWSGPRFFGLKRRKTNLRDHDGTGAETDRP